MGILFHPAATSNRGSLSRTRLFRRMGVQCGYDVAFELFGGRLDRSLGPGARRGESHWTCGFTSCRAVGSYAEASIERIARALYFLNNAIASRAAAATGQPEGSGVGAT